MSWCTVPRLDVERVYIAPQGTKFRGVRGDIRVRRIHAAAHGSEFVVRLGTLACRAAMFSVLVVIEDVCVATGSVSLPSASVLLV
jgi:hypothetical protein